MRAAGMILLALACTLLGVLQARRLTARVKQLEAVMFMLNAVEAQLRYCCCPVDDLLISLEGREELGALKFISLCVEKRQVGEEFPQAWRSSVMSTEAAGALNTGDTEQLLSFGLRLGTTSLEGQLSSCELYSSVFLERLETARAAMKKYSRLYPVLGALAGAAIIVLLV